GERTMRVRLIIGEMVVLAMYRDPAGGRILQAADTDDGKGILRPFRAAKTAMAQQTMVAKIDSDAAEKIHAEKRKRGAGPAEIPGNEGQQGQHMIAADSEGVAPVDAAPVDARGERYARRRIDPPRPVDSTKVH